MLLIRPRWNWIPTNTFCSCSQIVSFLLRAIQFNFFAKTRFCPVVKLHHYLYGRCLVHLSRKGAAVSMFAPDIPQMHVIDHTKGEEMQPNRNVLVESARIARGNVKPLSQYVCLCYVAVLRHIKISTCWTTQTSLVQIARWLLICAQFVPQLLSILSYSCARHEPWMWNFTSARNVIMRWLHIHTVERMT